MQRILVCLQFLYFTTYVFGQSCSGSVGDNIFPDGTFGSGTSNILQTDPRLAPGYTYQFNPPPDDGFYTITNNTTPWGSFAADSWINIRNNSNDPNGYMMVVNASFSPGLFYEKTVTVCGNINYEFSADVISMNDPTRGTGFIPPNISFLINDTVVYSTGDVPVDARWHTYGFTFITEPDATQIKLALRNNAPGGFGNDLALDNITFRPCGPTVLLIDTAAFCTPNREIIIRSEVIGSAYANPVFQWQQSATGTSNWTDIPGEISATLDLNNPLDGQYFRLTAASSPANLAQNSCRITSNPTRVTYLPERDTIRRKICLGDTIRIANQPFFQAGFTDITGKAVNGCDSVATVIIEVEDLSNFTIAGDTVFCKGDTATLNAGDFAKYAWSNGASTPDLSVSTEGIYGVTVTSTLGCIGSDTIQVYESSINSITTDLSPPVCPGSNDGQIRIAEVQGNAPPYLFSLNGSAFQNTPEFSNLPPGNFRIAVQDANSCEFQDTLTLPEPRPLVIQMTDDQMIEIGDSLPIELFTRARIQDYQWSPAEGLSCTDCAMPWARPLTSTIYTVTATDERGCSATDSVSITVDNPRRLYAPNAFSPNGDGINDRFAVFTGFGAEEIVRFEVFDRWGNQLYGVSNVPADADFKGWDGMSNGQIVPMGTYVWFANIRFFDGIIKQFKGEINLLR